MSFLAGETPKRKKSRERTKRSANMSRGRKNASLAAVAAVAAEAADPLTDEERKLVDPIITELRRAKTNPAT